MQHKYKTLLAKNGISTPLRVAHFMAQLEHESGLRPVAENLNYSAKRLREVFLKYFPTIEKANAYGNNPEKIANLVYANRMGNGPEQSGDGWKYRGRGFIQITGKNNYKALSEAMGIDYLNNPGWLLREADAMISAVWYWNSINGNKLADADNIKAITKAINGGYNGLEHRTALLKKWKAKLGI